MALSVVTVQIAGVGKEAVEVTPTPSQTVILDEFLQTIDYTYLNLADAETGATLLEKLEATTLPNGMNAFALYESMIVDPVLYSAKVEANKLRLDPATAIAALQVDVADHEDRIVALETAP
jgi:hypothetical protein